MYYANKPIYHFIVLLTLCLASPCLLAQSDTPPSSSSSSTDVELDLESTTHGEPTSSISPEQLEELLDQIQTLQQNYDKLKAEYDLLTEKAAALENKLNRQVQPNEIPANANYALRYTFRKLTSKEIQKLDTQLQAGGVVHSHKDILDNYIAAQITIRNMSKKPQRYNLDVGLTNQKLKPSADNSNTDFLDNFSISTDYIQPRRAYTATKFLNNVGSKENYLIATNASAFMISSK
ncbi:hypothetical protein KS4_08130 [Poriferisphaera corsica]|uniref:Uncharacterized protein n=1 Tax=Poriferisphaera corsica TaxID=2528020 RepID=A0A517YRC8_9BACT|nr:cell division protein ZapB [Poriferisphaera corsica]QDU32779.1 hypothetical protein KS4_08130 [Poriferisphaera corsica]